MLAWRQPQNRAGQLFAEFPPNPERQTMRRLHPNPVPQTRTAIDCDSGFPDAYGRGSNLRLTPGIAQASLGLKAPSLTFQAVPTILVDVDVEALEVAFHPVNAVRRGWQIVWAPFRLFFVSGQPQHFFSSRRSLPRERAIQGIFQVRQYSSLSLASSARRDIKRPSCGPWCSVLMPSALGCHV